MATASKRRLEQLEQLEQRLTPRRLPLTPQEKVDHARIDELMREQPGLTLKDAWFLMFEEHY